MITSATAPAGPTPVASDTPLAAAFKLEFERLLKEPLTVQQAARIARFAASAVKTLQSVATGVDGIMPRKKLPSWLTGTPEGEVIEEGLDTPSFNPAPGGLAENMGNTVVREAVALLPEYMAKRKIKDLVDTMAAAKQAGLDDVVRDLREELNVALNKPPAPALPVPGAIRPTGEEAPVAVGFVCSAHDMGGA